MCFPASCFICTLYLTALYCTLWTPNEHYSHKSRQTPLCSCFRRRTNIICISNSYRMRSIPPSVLTRFKKHRRIYHLPESASCPSSTEPAGQGAGSLYRLKPRMQERSESAMQKPFPELINEPGETGRGQSPSRIPATTTRGTGREAAPSAGFALTGCGRGRCLRLCARSPAQRDLARPGQPAGKDTAAAGPPASATCAGDTGPPAARSPGAGGGVAALTCSRCSSRKPSLTELHLPPAGRGKGRRESTQRCRPPPQLPLSVTAVPRPRCPAQRPPLARPPCRRHRERESQTHLPPPPPPSHEVTGRRALPPLAARSGPGSRAPPRSAPAAAAPSPRRSPARGRPRGRFPPSLPRRPWASVASALLDDAGGKAGACTTSAPPPRRVPRQREMGSAASFPFPSSWKSPCSGLPAARWGTLQ